MPRYSIAQIDQELKEAAKRKAADLDLIHRALLDVIDMDKRIDGFLKARRELTEPGRHRADA